MNNNKLSILGHVIFVIVLLVSLGYVLVAHKGYDGSEFVFDDGSLIEWNDSWDVNYDGTIIQDVTLPLGVPVKKGNSVILRKTLPEKIKKYNCIMIESKHQDISVSIGGIQRAYYSNENYRKWGKTSPSGIVLVPLYNTDSLEDVAIRITSDSVYSGDISKIYLGNEKSLVVQVLKSNMAWLFLTVIVLIIGISSFVCFVIYNSSFEIGKALHYLSLFAILSAIWSFTQTGLRQVFFEDLAVLEAIGYCCYMIIPVVFLLYVNSIFDKKYNYAVVPYSIVVLLNFLIENILVWEFKIGFFEMRYASNQIFILGIVLSVVFLIRDMRDGIQAKHRNLLVGILGLFVGILTQFSFEDYRFLGEASNRYIGGAFIFSAAGFIYTSVCIGREQKQKKDAENANKAKTLFLAAMSHEIKTPLNAMLGMNEIIKRDSNQQVITDCANNISEAGQTLVALVNNILDFSLIEAGQTSLANEIYNMKPLLKDLVLMTESKVKNKEVKFIVDIDECIPVEYSGDRIKIKQVLFNLLSNAVKYTPQGEIKFTVRQQSKIDNKIDLFFSVKDTGTGIREEDIEKIKHSFTRNKDVVNSNIDGTGLGLSIVTSLLEMMGSKLEIQSKFGEGSEFSFVLSQQVVDQTPMGSLDEDKQKEKKKKKLSFTAPDIKILAVDDNKMNLTVLKGILKTTKMQIDVCLSGAECLERCKDTYYDIIFMDHMMPEMDGIETFKRIRNSNDLKSTDSTVFVLTANTVSGAEEMYLECGFDYYLKKPIDVNELNDVLQKFIPMEKITPME